MAGVVLVEPHGQHGAGRRILAEPAADAPAGFLQVALRGGPQTGVAFVQVATPNCSAITSGEWFGNITPPAPTRMVDVPAATRPITTAVAVLAMPAML